MMLTIKLRHISQPNKKPSASFDKLRTEGLNKYSVIHLRQSFGEQIRIKQSQHQRRLL